MSVRKPEAIGTCQRSSALVSTSKHKLTTRKEEMKGGGEKVTAVKRSLGG